jgi:hypothetical protein
MSNPDTHMAPAVCTAQRIATSAPAADLTNSAATLGPCAHTCLNRRARNAYTSAPQP